MAITGALKIKVPEALYAGEKARHISNRLGVRYHDVRMLCIANGIILKRGPSPGSRSKLTKHARNDEIVRRLMALEPGTAIAADLGLTRERVYQIGRRHGLDIPVLLNARTQRRIDSKRAQKMEARKSGKAAQRAYYKLLADKIREVKLAGHSWAEVGEILFMPTMTCHRIALSHYPELRKGRGRWGR